MSDLEFRTLRANEIECRPVYVGNGFAKLLLYKNARCDMNILDETVGVMNWTRKHYECKGNLFCEVSINKNYNEPDKEPYWITKSDCGSESNCNKEKGEASDSFKRACVNWGIGRELYSNIQIIAKAETEPGAFDTYRLKDTKFHVSDITINNDKQITYLEIKNNKDIVVFTFGNKDTSVKNNVSSDDLDSKSKSIKSITSIENEVTKNPKDNNMAKGEPITTNNYTGTNNILQQNVFKSNGKPLIKKELQFKKVPKEVEVETEKEIEINDDKVVNQSNIEIDKNEESKELQQNNTNNSNLALNGKIRVRREYK